MSLHTHHFDFAGARVRVESDSEQSADALRRDFSGFIAPPSGDALVWRVNLSRSQIARAPKKGRPWTAWSSAHIRHVAYDDGAYGYLDRDRSFGEIFCEDPVRLQEVSHLAVLSAVGEDLDRRGLHRVHALGFEKDGAAGLILLPSGGGKSELTLELLSRGTVNLLSEDTPLIDAATTVAPFPVRLSFRPSADLSAIPPHFIRPYKRRLFGERRLVDISHFSDALADPAPLRWIFIGQKSVAAPAELKPASRLEAMAALFEALVVGVGVPQMAEWRLRPDFNCAAGLAHACASRLHAAGAAAASAQAVRFRLAPTASESATALERWLDGSRRNNRL